MAGHVLQPELAVSDEPARFVGEVDTPQLVIGVPGPGASAGDFKRTALAEIV